MQLQVNLHNCLSQVCVLTSLVKIMTAKTIHGPGHTACTVPHYLFIYLLLCIT